jgi:hypothetical protein
MPQKRIAIDLTEILHLEIYCDHCKNVNTLPLTNPPPQSSGPIRGSHPGLSKCLSCGVLFNTVSGLQDAVQKLQELLINARRLGNSPFTIRLIAQQ